MSREFFAQVSGHLAGFLPPALRGFTLRRGARNLKLWFGEEAREHYEVQVIAASIARTRGPVLEIGFHAEHPDPDRNDRVLGLLLRQQRAWRRALGPQPTAGPFIGRQAGRWRRLSETWEGPGLTTPEAALEAAERLAAYVRALEPLRAGAEPG